MAEDALITLAEKIPNNVDVLRELGRLYFSTGDKEACFQVTRRALEIANEVGDREGELNALGNLAYLYLRWDGATETAKNSLLKVVELAERIGDPSAVGINSFRLGELEARRAKFGAALTYLDRAENLIDYVPPSFRIQIRSTRGEVYRRLHRYDRSLNELHIAQDIINNHNFQDSYSSILVDSYLAQVYWKTGRLDTAIDIANNSLRRADSLYLVDSMVALRGMLGQMYMEYSMFDESISMHKEALVIASEDDASHRIYGAYIDLGHAYACVMNFENSEKYFRMALEDLDGTSDSLAIGKAMVGIAITYSVVDNWELADKYLNDALVYLDGRDVPNSLGQLFQWLAEVSRQRGDLESASGYLARAEEFAKDTYRRFEVERLRGEIALVSAKYQPALLAFNRALRPKNIPLHAWRARMGRAIAFWKLDRREEAEAEFERAIAEVERQRQNEGSALDRSLMAAGRYDLYESYASFLDEQSRYADAIHADERGRSRALTDLLFTTQQGRGKVDGHAVERAISARMRSQALSRERAELAGATDFRGSRTERIEEIDREQRTLEGLGDEFQVDLIGSDPLYAFEPVGTDLVQEALRPEEAIVVYSLRVESLNGEGALVAYVIREDSIAFVPLNHDPVALDESVRFFRDAITDSERGPGSGWQPAARKLYEWLIAPVLPFVGRETTHLHIIPEGPLHYLPFSALQDEKQNYLVERYDLSYAPSLTVLKLCQEQNPLRWSRMLLLADPNDDLPGAQHEAKLIAAKETRYRRLVIGEDATQELLQREAPKYDIIHLATHGVFRARTPLASHLRLYDDVLTVDEIGELDLNAYLVTLSACQTALSGGLMQDHAPGEEWIGLYQAFLAAGTPTVLASLWTIHDRFSGPLMSRFYDRLETQGKARALAEVQRGFIHDRRTSHPYYWAAFSVLGDPR